MATISDTSKEASDAVEDMKEDVEAVPSAEAIPSTDDMERDDENEGMESKTMKVDKETLKAAMKEIKDEENLWYMVENKNEESLKVMEKLIAKRRAELKKGGSKSNTIKEVPNY